MQAVHNAVIAIFNAAQLQCCMQNKSMISVFIEVNNMQHQCGCSVFTSASCCCFYLSSDIPQSVDDCICACFNIGKLNHL
jgi:hypothetical protein